MPPYPLRVSRSGSHGEPAHGTQGGQGSGWRNPERPARAIRPLYDHITGGRISFAGRACSGLYEHFAGTP